MRKASKKPEWQKRIAKERISILFREAEASFREHPERSHRYMDLVSRIAKRYTLRLSRKEKRKFCGKCHHYLKPGVNSRVRTRSSQKALIVECKDCKAISRHPYS